MILYIMYITTYTTKFRKLKTMTAFQNSEIKNLTTLVSLLEKNNNIPQSEYDRFPVKRGLRNSDGTGVMAGLTKVCSVDGYYLYDGERIPMEGRLEFRGVDIYDIIKGIQNEDRFGYEEVVWLLLFGFLPTKEQLDDFCDLLSSLRELPDDFIEDMIMKAPSPDIMNKLACSVLALYSYDDNAEDPSIENILSQSLGLIARMPAIMSYAYQVKRRHYYRKSMYIHQLNPEQKTAEMILNSIRPDKKFTDEEAKLLDILLILQAEHGGGNNSTFNVRSLSSSGTDTYSAISAGIGALKGPKHGGANHKVAEMLDDFKANVENLLDDGQIADHIEKIVKKEAGDRTGLVYGMGHAVYTLSDPRAVILKEEARKIAETNGCYEEFALIDAIERLTPEVFAKVKKSNKKISANVDLYSGLIYKILKIPQDLYTPLFTVARTAGWCAHRIEEILTNGRIMRPAYKSLALPMNYIPLDERTKDIMELADKEYIPIEERI